jgi:hypothetical protein
LPKEIEIYDLEFASNTCLKVSGFSDEISCNLKAESNGKLALIVKGGFDSSTYPARLPFSFIISELRNPRTTAESGTFNV